MKLRLDRLHVERPEVAVGVRFLNLSTHIIVVDV